MIVASFAFYCLAQFSSIAAAQTLVPADFNPLSASPLAEEDNHLQAPSRDYYGLPFQGWLLYPQVFLGSVLDDNVFQTATQRKSAVGFEVNPSISAELDNGIHKTTIYGDGDFRIYPWTSDANSATGRLGLIHVYEIQKDLVLRLQGDVTRQQDIFNTGEVLGPAGVTNLATPEFSTTYLGSASLEKSFDRLFVDLGGTVAYTAYDSIKDTLGTNLSQSFRDGTTSTINGRIGYWIVPQFNLFAEPSYNWQSYQTSLYDSHGYRVTGGVSSDRIGLFSGEVYAGYQNQRYDSDLFGSAAGGVFGGRLYWYATPFWTVSAQADQNLGLASVTTLGTLGAAPTKADSFKLASDYSLSQIWSLSGGITFQYVDYVNQPRRDDDWSVDAALNYHLWLNTSATLKYQFTDVSSNMPGLSFDRNVVSLGATYKY